MADETLTFLSWVQERIAGLATGQSDGRASCVATVTLTGKRADGATTDTQTRDLRFLLAGPADVISLERRAVVRRYPAPGTLDHESNRCPYVELADPSLPWRYTPAPKPAAGTGNLHPWLVLVVGVEGTEITLNGDQVTIEPTAQVDAQALGTPTSAYRFAHVQVDVEGRRTARILSGRAPLEPGAEYIAVLVPAFDETGERRWTGTAAVTVPAYDSWRFRTAEPAGSFEDLAARLQPGAAAATIGQAILRYPRLAEAPELAVRGALIASTGDEPAPEDPLPAVIADDVARLRLPAHDPQGRPIVTMPRYGDAWGTRAPEEPEPPCGRRRSTATPATAAPPAWAWRSASGSRRSWSPRRSLTSARSQKLASAYGTWSWAWWRRSRCGAAAYPRTGCNDSGCLVRRCRVWRPTVAR